MDELPSCTPSTVQLPVGTRVWLAHNSGARVPIDFLESRATEALIARMTYNPLYAFPPNAKTTALSVFFNKDECMFVRSTPSILRPKPRWPPKEK
jgi:hypothetical protein